MIKTEKFLRGRQIFFKKDAKKNSFGREYGGMFCGLDVYNGALLEKLAMNTLFGKYPELRESIPVRAFAALPTPLEPLESLAKRAGAAGIWVKRDDLTSPVYGGNKVRKLSCLMAAALGHGARTVITFGGAGSNHALATALTASRLGLKCVSILGPQHNARSVGRNLLAAHRAGACLCPCAWRETAAETRRRFWEAAKEDGVTPYVIPPGGSSPLGALGFVDAALELIAQAEAAGLPMPGTVYAASGTMGTCVGLALGFALAGVPVRVEAVRVTTSPYTSEGHARALFRAANHWLHDADETVPLVPFPGDSFRIRDDFFGKEYALYTPESAEAVARARGEWGLSLEGTYTGKTFAALLHDAETGAVRGESLVFWNTHNSRDLSPLTAGADYHELPVPLHRYFEEPVQPLDRG